MKNRNTFAIQPFCESGTGAILSNTTAAHSTVQLIPLVCSSGVFETISHSKASKVSTCQCTYPMSTRWASATTNDPPSDQTDLESMPQIGRAHV